MTAPKDGSAAPKDGQDRIWTPSNIITMIRILLVPVFITVLLAPWPDWFGLAHIVTDQVKRICAAIVFIVISCTDWLDGYLARSRGEVTNFGKFIDPLADKILVAGALIALVELDALPTWVVLIILSREFIVSGVRMMAASKGVVIAASMLGKFKTVFQMIAIVLFVLKDSHMTGTIDSAASDALWVISWIFMIIALVLTVVSLVDYLVNARELFGFGNSTPGLSADGIIPIESGTLAEESLKVIELAGATHITIATAESLTGGMIGELLTSIPGSSSVYMGGIVSYAAEVKHRILGVSQEVIQSDGVVSEACARQMAEGARSALGTTVAVAVTGIAGPGGAEPGKPVGTVWVALAAEGETLARKLALDGDRSAIREATAYEALSLLEAWMKSI